MTQSLEAKALHLDHEQESTLRTIYGFWVYLMTDCILFGTLFASYAVLHGGTYGGPTPKELFDLPYVLIQTLLLLTSSFTCGLGMLAAHRDEKNKVFFHFVITFLLGAAFLMMELSEFSHLVHEGYSWQRSAFLSSYFTLVGTHGAHITTGLIWISFQLYQIYSRGISMVMLKRLTCLTLFWHFLDVVWIFIFTIVYMMGKIA